MAGNKDVMRVCPKHRAQFDEPPVFAGDGRYGILDIFDNSRLIPSCHSPLRITAIADETIVTTLSTSPDNNRRIEVVGVDGGYVVKGRQINTFTRYDTTTESQMVMIKLTVHAATWVQTSEWRMTLNIVSGEFAGKITLYGPAFNMDQYSDLCFWVTNDGASYYGSACDCSFEHFGAGCSVAAEDLTSNVSAGSSVLCAVSDTTGFYLGDKVYIEDNESSEWCRIKEIDTNTSITVDSLTYNYTTANGVSINKNACIRTPTYRRKLRRCLIRYPSMKAGVNTGVTAQMGLPHSKDDTEDITVLVQYMGSTDNATSKKIKIRLQYITISIDTVCEPSDERGTVQYGYLTPPTAAYTHTYESIFTVTPTDIGTAHAAAFQIARMGIDAEDTYDGDLTIIAVLVLTKNNRIGMSV